MRAQKAEQLATAGDRAGAATHFRLARDAFQRCRDLKYRLDGVNYHMARIESGCPARVTS